MLQYKNIYVLFSNWQEIESQLDEFVDILTQEFLQPDIHGLRKGPSA